MAGQKKTTISLDVETHNLLCTLGHKGETFDKIVRRLIAFYQKYKEKGAISDEF